MNDDELSHGSRCRGRNDRNDRNGNLVIFPESRSLDDPVCEGNVVEWTLGKDSRRESCVINRTEDVEAKLRLIASSWPSCCLGGIQDYLAPEMLMERPYTTSVDLWAAGVVTYEFLVGRSPFRR